jgi:hypothetical protein
MNSQVLAASIGHSMSAGELPASTDADSLAAVILAVLEGLEAQWLLDDFVNPVRGAQTLRAFIRRYRRVQRGDEARPGRGRRLSGLGDRRWSVRQRTSGQVATKHHLRQALLLVRWAPRVRLRQRCSGEFHH